MFLVILGYYEVLNTSFDVTNIMHFFFIGIVTVIIILLSIYWIGVDVLTKQKVWSYIKRKLTSQKAV